MPDILPSPEQRISVSHERAVAPVSAHDEDTVPDKGLPVTFAAAVATAPSAPETVDVVNLTGVGPTSHPSRLPVPLPLRLLSRSSQYYVGMSCCAI